MDPKEVYRLAYTGGTTGRSKGVLLTLRTLQAQVSNYLLEHVPGIARGDVMLHAAPVSHASGSYFLPHLVRGAHERAAARASAPASTWSGWSAPARSARSWCRR